MDNLEKELTELLKNESGLEAGKDETARKEIAQMEGFFERFVTNVQRARLVFWVFFLLCLGMMVGGYIGLRYAGNTKEMLYWVIFFMIGFNSTILMKLWYWVVSTKLNILKEIKQLQLQIAELTDKEPPSEN